MKALNRKEVLVNAKANGTLDSFKPLTRDEAFTKKALGLGGGASSWNDLTDKPFGEIVRKTILPETAFTTKNVTYVGIAANTGLPIDTFVDGVKYFVKVNGVEYSSVAYTTDNGVWLGNSSLVNDSNAHISDEPFCFAVTFLTDPIYFATENAGDYTVSIEVEGVSTLDPQYSPDTIVDFTIDWDTGTANASMTVREIYNAVASGENVTGRAFSDGYFAIFTLSQAGLEDNEYFIEFNRSNIYPVGNDGYELYYEGIIMTDGNKGTHTVTTFTLTAVQ